MRYERSVVTFVDILGFSNLVENQSAADIVEMLDAISETAARPLDSDENRTSVVSFSDSVIRARPIDPETIYDALLHEIQDLATAQWQLLEIGILIRGGTTVGNVSVGNGRAFGPAFVQAYRLESSLAASPRIVLDPGVIEGIRTHLSGARQTGDRSELITELRNHIRLGDDGVWFIDYINSVYIVSGERFVREGLSKMREFIIASARKYEDRPLVIPKYLWQIRYHNLTVRRLFPGDTKLRIKASEVPASDEFLKPRTKRRAQNNSGHLQHHPSREKA